jgi:hypothetical protein
MKAHFSALSSFEIEEATQKAGVSLSSNVYDIVVGNSIDEFVVRIDASACRHLVHDNLKALVRLSDLFLLEIEWLLLIFLPTENTNVDVIAQRHRSLVSAAI